MMGEIFDALRRAHNQMVVDGTLCAQCWEMGVDCMADRCEDPTHLKHCQGCGQQFKKMYRCDDVEGRVRMLCSHCIDE